MPMETILIVFIAAGFCVFAGTLYWADVQTRGHGCATRARQTLARREPGGNARQRQARPAGARPDRRRRQGGTWEDHHR